MRGTMRIKDFLAADEIGRRVKPVNQRFEKAPAKAIQAADSNVFPCSQGINSSTKSPFMQKCCSPLSAQQPAIGLQYQSTATMQRFLSESDCGKDTYRQAHRTRAINRRQIKWTGKQICEGCSARAQIRTRDLGCAQGGKCLAGCLCPHLHSNTKCTNQINCSSTPINSVTMVHCSQAYRQMETECRCSNEWKSRSFIACCSSR